jgi:ATP-dependent Clp protease ATP-binding subunit ClpA
VIGYIPHTMYQSRRTEVCPLRCISGIFTFKKVASRGTDSATSQIKCSKTLWLLTTNKFDDDIHVFNDRHITTISAYEEGRVPFNDLQESFDGFIRPKLRSFFKGGLTRRIDAVVPFFKFSREEAYVVADMYIDTVREMYARPRTPGGSRALHLS